MSESSKGWDLFKRAVLHGEIQGFNSFMFLFDVELVAMIGSYLPKDCLYVNPLYRAYFEEEQRPISPMLTFNNQGTMEISLDFRLSLWRNGIRDTLVDIEINSMIPSPVYIPLTSRYTLHLHSISVNPTSPSSLERILQITLDIYDSSTASSTSGIISAPYFAGGSLSSAANAFIILERVAHLSTALILSSFSVAHYQPKWSSITLQISRGIQHTI